MCSTLICFLFICECTHTWSFNVSKISKWHGGGGIRTTPGLHKSLVLLLILVPWFTFTQSAFSFGKLAISTVARYGTPQGVFSSRHQRHSASGSPASSRISPRRPACDLRAPREKLEFRARICKRLRSPGIDFASLCSLAVRYENPICRTGTIILFVVHAR
jgi:hypothetical protein